jgi:hypothetical protein
MKKLLIISLLFLASCKERDITGYIVYKEYVPEHMCHDDVTTEYEAGVIVVPHTHVHHHSKQEASWTLYVGTKDYTEQVSVTKNCYNSFKVTDKVRVYGNGVELIKRGCK